MKENGPIRTCVGCGQKFNKSHLIRFVTDGQGSLIPDLKGKLPGRGVSVCLKKKCFQTALKKNSFTRQLGSDIESKSLVEIAVALIDAETRYLFTLMRVGFGGRKLIDGLDLCAKQIEAGELKLCLIAEDISMNSMKKIQPVLNKSSLKWLMLPEKMVISDNLNRPVRAVFGVTDVQLAETIAETLDRIVEVKTWMD